jgi:hypothetical protein
MAFTLTCPSCSTKLKTAAALPIGRLAQCPKCSTTFPVSANNQAEITDAPKPASPPAPKPAAPAPPTPPPVEPPRAAPAAENAPSRSSRVDDDEEYVPRSRRRDDDDDDYEPRSRRRDDDDRNRRRRDDDEDDDDRSRRRRSRDDDDYEPRSRRRSRDDDDNRPRRRGRDVDYSRSRGRSRRKRKGNKGLMIGLAIAGLAAIAGLVWLLVWLFSGGSYDKEMMAYMPENTQILVGVDVDHLMSLDGVKELLDNNNMAAAMAGGFGGGAEIEAFQKTGVKLKDIKRIMIGMPDPAKASGTVAVIRFRNSVDKGMINSAVSAAEQKAGDKVYYRSSIKGACLHYGDDDLLVIAENEETMKKVLSKEQGTGQNRHQRYAEGTGR